MSCMTIIIRTSVFLIIDTIQVAVRNWTTVVFWRTGHGGAFIFRIVYSIIICIRQGAAVIGCKPCNVRAQIILIRQTIVIPVGATIGYSETGDVRTFIFKIGKTIVILIPW